MDNSYGRSEHFEPEDVLALAMGVFWQRGYEATSIQDLVAATGLNGGVYTPPFVTRSSSFWRSWRIMRIASAVR